MALLDDRVRKQLSDILKNLQNPVHLAFFTQEFECDTCAHTREFVGEIASLSDRITYDVWDFVKDREVSNRYGIDKIPAIKLLDANRNDRGITYYGLPGGYEINSFLGTMLELAGGREPLPAGYMERVAKIQKDIWIQVFVSLSCPACPNAVMTAHRIAMENARVKADMVDSQVFPHLAIRYGVSSVPKIVINDKLEFVGAQPMSVFLDSIEKV